jgi:hypothetical protein
MSAPLSSSLRCESAASPRQREALARPEPLPGTSSPGWRISSRTADTTDVALQATTDREIWDFAGEHGCCTVSKDSDFRQLAFLLGPPPKAVWLAVGNASTGDVFDLLV